MTNWANWKAWETWATWLAVAVMLLTAMVTCGADESPLKLGGQPTWFAPTATSKRDAPPPKVTCPNAAERAYFDMVAKITKESSIAEDGNPAIANDIFWEHDILATPEEMRPPADALADASVPPSV